MPATPEPLLQLRDWSLVRNVSGGRRAILEMIDLDILPGRWTAVLGANGSGKSSLLKYLASEESPLADEAAIMFQDPDEQIFAASVARELSLGRRDLLVDSCLLDFGLEGLGMMDPRLLSAGQKQRLALATALGTGPRVLLCDEPTALQDAEQSRWVLDRLQGWLQAGDRALVTATCDRAEAARADHLVVLHAGRIVAQGPTAELLDAPEVTELLGTGVPVTPREIPDPDTGSAALLELEDITCHLAGPGGGFRGIGLDVRPGARIGISGPNGCGKSTLLAVGAGARRPDGGRVRLGGRLLYARKSRELDHGAAMLAPQFPEYMFTQATVAREILLDPVLSSSEPEAVLEKLGLSKGLADRNPHDLSSGQRRRLALGLVIMSGRPVLLLDEPTAALDRAGRAMVLKLLAAVGPDQAVVIATHDRDFLQEAGFSVRTLGPAGWLRP